MVINEFIDAMMNKDHEALADCFSEHCTFVDYCPSMADRQNTFLYGPNSINMYFHNRFMFNGFTMLDPRIIDHSSANFFVNYGGRLVHAVAEIVTFGSAEDNPAEKRIKDLVIRPA